MNLNFMCKNLKRAHRLPPGWHQRYRRHWEGTDASTSNFMGTGTSSPL